MVDGVGGVLDGGGDPFCHLVETTQGGRAFALCPVGSGSSRDRFHRIDDAEGDDGCRVRHRFASLLSAGDADVDRDVVVRLQILPVRQAHSRDGYHRHVGAGHRR